MPTMKDFTTVYAVTGNTIRRWTKDFADFLDPGANPEPGEIRRYTDSDAEVIDKIAELKKEKFTADKIRTALDAGERGSWPPEGYEPAYSEPEAPQSVMIRDNAMLAELSHKAGFLEGQLATMTEDRNYWRDRANKAEDQLRLLAAPTPEEVTPDPAPATSEPEKKPGFWQRLFNRG